MKATGLPIEAVQVVEPTDRAAVSALIQMDEFVDVIVPRGGKGLIERVTNESRVPVIKHLDGVCHVYVDDDADLEKAVTVSVNAKTQRYGTCNTMETLLVAQSRASEVLPSIAQHLREAGVEMRGCERAQVIVPDAIAATEDDWYEEFLAPVLAIRVVDDYAQAVEHIAKYGSQHTDAIITENFQRARDFLVDVD